MAKKSNGWNLQQMQDTLVKDTEEKIASGFEQIANGERDTIEQSEQTAAPAAQQQEPTKGIQTDVPMSLYVRLVNMKLRRGEPICAMMIKALESWLTQQEKL